MCELFCCGLHSSDYFPEARGTLSLRVCPCRYFDALSIMSKRPNGVRLHVVDVFVDELEAAFPIVRAYSSVCAQCARVVAHAVVLAMGLFGASCHYPLPSPPPPTFL